MNPRDMSNSFIVSVKFNDDRFRSESFYYLSDALAYVADMAETSNMVENIILIMPEYYKNRT